MIRLFITRHGETRWNSEGRMQGWNNSNLTEKGIYQAELLGKRLAQYDIDEIYTSPLQRAIDTTNIISNGRKISIIQDSRLKEIHMGKWEGKLICEIKRDNPKEFHDFCNNPKLCNPCMGESFSDIYNRISSFLEEIIKNSDGKNVLIVTHGVTLKAIMCYFSNEPIEKAWSNEVMGQTSLTIVEIYGQETKIQIRGDVEHLSNII